MMLLSHYLLMAWRHFIKYRSYTVINVASLAIGLICFLIAYASYLYVNSVDHEIEGVDRTHFLYKRSQQPGTNHWSPYSTEISPAAYKYLEQNLPGIEVIARSGRIEDLVIQVGSNRAYRNVMFASSSFFDIYTEWDFVTRSGESPLSLPRSAVISRVGAQKIFGTEDVLGETLLLEGRYDITVAGVVDDLPQNSYAGKCLVEEPWDVLVSIDVFNELQSQRLGFDVRDTATSDVWNISLYVTHIRLKQGAGDRHRLEDDLLRFADDYRPEETGRLELRAEPVDKYVSFVMNQRILGDGRGIPVTGVLLILGAVVLLVSCLNYSNLAIAQTGSRIKETGLRKVVGAGRSEIFKQLITEISCHAIVATVVALVSVLILVPILRARLGLAIDVGLLVNWRSLLVVLGSIVFVSLASGLYPSVSMAGLRPALSLQQGQSKMGARRLIGAMSGVQFTVSSFLLIAVITMFLHNTAQRQNSTGDVGGEQVVLLENHLLESAVGFETLRDRLITQDGVISVSGSYDLPFGTSLGDGGYRTVISESMDEESSHLDMQRKMVNYDYFKTLGLEILHGRAFGREFGGDETPLPMLPAFLTFTGPGRVVVDLATANELTGGRPDEAVGKLIYEKDLVDARGERASMRLEIIGVVEDSPYRLVSDSVERELYLLQPLAAVRPVVRIGGQRVQETLTHIDKTWESLEARQPIRRAFIDERFDRAYSFFHATARTFTGLSLIAFAIAGSGLVAMASYLLQRRRHEIAIRKVLGAHHQEILRMLLVAMSRPIVVGNLVAWPIAFVAMRRYFAQFVEGPGDMFWVYPVALLIAISIGWVAVGGQLWGTKKIKPATMLRYQ